ncbi:hypothetical protein ACLM5H_24435 [Fredinandcohnia humi]
MIYVKGACIGLLVSFIGSMVLGAYPYLPFHVIFLTSALPSALVFGIMTYFVKTDESKVYYWIRAWLSLFIVGIIAFTIKTYFEARAIAVNPYGSTLNWDAVILFNILYSVGAAILFSPMGMYALQRLALYKKQQLNHQ